MEAAETYTDRQHLRVKQAKRVMRLVGPLLDAWEGTPNDLRGLIEEQAPQLRRYLDRIASAMEAG